MTILQVLGWIMLIAPFVAIFGLTTKTEGFKVAAMIHTLAALILAVVYVGVQLTGIGQ